MNQDQRPTVTVAVPAAIWDRGNAGDLSGPVLLEARATTPHEADPADADGSVSFRFGTDAAGLADLLGLALIWTPEGGHTVTFVREGAA
jgi:hypothetical protein